MTRRVGARWNLAGFVLLAAGVALVVSSLVVHALRAVTG